MNLLKRLPPFDAKSGTLNVVIDTPKGCRSKFASDMKRKAYMLKSVLPPRKSRNCSKRLRRTPWKTLNGDAYSTTAHLAQWRKANVAALARSSVRDLQVFGDRLRSDVNFPRLSMSAFSRFCRESYSSSHC
jgi:hypothetical protein